MSEWHSIQNPQSKIQNQKSCRTRKGTRQTGPPPRRHQKKCQTKPIWDRRKAQCRLTFSWLRSTRGVASEANLLRVERLASTLGKTRSSRSRRGVGVKRGLGAESQSTELSSRTTGLSSRRSGRLDLDAFVGVLDFLDLDAERADLRDWRQFSPVLLEIGRYISSNLSRAAQLNGGVRRPAPNARRTAGSGDPRRTEPPSSLATRHSPLRSDQATVIESSR